MSSRRNLTQNSSEIYDFKYLFSTEMERNFDGIGFVESMKKGWHYSVVISVVYLLLVFLGKLWMKPRQNFDLKIPLIAWNLSLAIFSICGASRIISEIYYCVTKHGFKYSVCNNDAGKLNNAAMFWAFLFAMSKVLELGDTGFIVLRKRKLLFLHWYHHVTVLINVWFSAAQANGSSRWFMGVNFTVHFFMYAYYFFRALRVRVPRWISISVTSLQLVQMLIGCVINYACFKALKNGEICEATVENILFSMGIYFSYLLLFAYFFWSAYLRKNEGRKKLK